MADFSSDEKLNLALKQVFGIQGLSNTEDSLGLEWYEERFSWKPYVLNSEIFANEVPIANDKTEADAAVTANPSLLEKVDLRLTLVSGTNGRAWAAFQIPGDETSPIVGDWLLPFVFGRGYALQLFQDNGSGTMPGTEITTTEGAWIPAYKLGMVILADDYTASDMSWSSPLWARVYRYKGPKGISGSTAGVNLDDAYNNGAIISVDSGPVVLDSSNDSASLQINPITYVPSSSLADGQIINNSGILYVYDSTRSKWISLVHQEISFETRVADGNYLSIGFHSSVNSGWTALRNGTILGITCSGSGNLSKNFSIRKAGSVSDLYSFSLTSGVFSDSTLNIDFSSDEILQIYASGNGAPASSVRASLFIGWRVV